LRRDLAEVWDQARPAEQRVSTVSLKSQFRFESPEQRAEFARALREAVVGVIARHTSPHALAAGPPAPGRPYRLVIACYPWAEPKEK
jgi:hypothetical protein